MVYIILFAALTINDTLTKLKDIDCVHILFTTDTATGAGNDQELSPNECEEHIPELNDILKASFASVRDFMILPIL